MMHPQSDFYYTNGSRLDEETKDRMVQIVEDLDELDVDEFNDTETITVGSFFDEAVRRLAREDESEMSETIKDYMQRYYMVS